MKTFAYGVMASLLALVGCGEIGDWTPLTGDAQSRLTLPRTVSVNVGLKSGSPRQWAQQKGLVVINEFPPLRAVTVAAPEGAGALISQLGQDPQVRFAEADRAVSMPKPSQRKSRLQILGNVLFDPGDPLVPRQYSLDIMQVKAAWQFTKGQGVKVAVMDTGFDYDHPDLKNQLLPGFSAVYGVEGRLFSSDQHGHGTHVSGIIGAEQGNRLGISGVAPQVKILPIKIEPDHYFERLRERFEPGFEMFQVTPEYTLSSIYVSGILKAVEQGAKVINLSYGSMFPVEIPPSFIGKGTDPWERMWEEDHLNHLRLYNEAVSYATSKGVSMVVSAGNSREEGSPPNLFALHRSVVGVAASDDQDRITTFSNKGTYVSVAAPGDQVLSTVPVTPFNATSAYEAWDGTSMAAPNVTGVVALMKAVNPRLTPAQVKNILEKTAEDKGQPGYDETFGHGRINALRAVQAARQTR